MRLQRERFRSWFFKALRTLFGVQGILFLLNLITVFFCWTLFILVYFAIDLMNPIPGLDILYANKIPAVLGFFIFFLLLTTSLAWTYWDAYVRLSKPDRHPKRQLKSTHLPPEKINIPDGLKRKSRKSPFTSTHATPEVAPTKSDPEEQQEEQQEQPQIVASPVKEKSGRGRPRGSRNKPKAQAQPKE